ncbi:MAG: hypothetical protein ACREPE_13890, partial [Lysobacter sp.]
VPELHFHYDDSVDRGERINNLLRDSTSIGEVEVEDDGVESDGVESDDDASDDGDAEAGRDRT